MTASGYERRLGARHSVAWLEVAWHYWIGPPVAAGPRPVGTATGYPVDVSVSGAGVVAPTSPYVDIGVAVAIEFGALHGAVIVRRVDVVNTDVDARLYGVEFVDANSELSVGLCDAFVARHSELPQWRDPRYGTGAFPTQTFGVGDTAPIDAGALGGRGNERGRAAPLAGCVASEVWSRTASPSPRCTRGHGARPGFTAIAPAERMIPRRAEPPCPRCRGPRRASGGAGRGPTVG